MRGVVSGLEAVALLIPDLQALGVIVLTIFSLCRCAPIVGGGPGDTSSALSICLIFGYLATVALKLASAAVLSLGPDQQPVSRASNDAEVEQAAILEQRRLA